MLHKYLMNEWTWTNILPPAGPRDLEADSRGSPQGCHVETRVAQAQLSAGMRAHFWGQGGSPGRCWQAWNSPMGSWPGIQMFRGAPVSDYRWPLRCSACVPLTEMGTVYGRHPKSRQHGRHSDETCRTWLVNLLSPQMWDHLVMCQPRIRMSSGGPK